MGKILQIPTNKQTKEFSFPECLFRIFHLILIFVTCAVFYLDDCRMHIYGYLTLDDAQKRIFFSRE